MSRLMIGAPLFYRILVLLSVLTATVQAQLPSESTSELYAVPQYSQLFQTLSFPGSASIVTEPTTEFAPLSATRMNFVASASFGPCDSLNTDASIVYNFNRVQSLHPYSHAISQCLIPAVVLGPAVLAATGFAKDDLLLKRESIALLSAEVSCGVLTYVTKNIVGRKRPWRSYPDCISTPDPDEEYSFPSGHASLSCCLATFVSLRYPKWYVIAPAGMYALGTCLARINLGVHYPSDVIVGALLGSALAYGAHRLTNSWTSDQVSGLRQSTKSPVDALPLMNFRISL